MAVLASACTTLPTLLPGSHEDLQYIAAATTADATTREAMWRSAAARERTPDASASAADTLRVAWLQSLPGHPGYDPGAAERRLQKVLTLDPAPDIGALARLRLAELRAAGGCREENEALKRRLVDLVDIERRMNHKE